MANLTERLISLTNAFGADIKAVLIKQGDLTALSTAAKGNLVAAINEINAALAGAGVVINDAAGDGDLAETWSANKIFETIEAAKLAVKNDLTAGASAALDTFNEFAEALGNNPNFATTIATELSNRVRFDAAQVLSAAQKTQACVNIGVGEPDTDFAAIYTAAKA